MADAFPVEALLERALDEIARERRFPEATYRLQFHAMPHRSSRRRISRRRRSSSNI